MKYLYKLVLVALISGLVLVALPSSTQAQLDECKNERLNSVTGGIGCLRAYVKDTGVSRAESAGPVLVTVINIILSFLAVIALLAIIVGGVMYILAFGSEDKIKQAKRIVIYAIVGLLIAGLSFTIILTVQNFFTDVPAKGAKK